MAQLAARRSHNPKVASSILAGSILFFIFVTFYFLQNKKNKTFPNRDSNPGRVGENHIS